MGTPRFYYYPDGGTALEYVDLGEELTDIDFVPGVRRQDAIALDGAASTALLGPSYSVRITLERFGSPGALELERKLQALISHLRRGGRCGFSRDHARTFAAVRSGVAGRGWGYVATAGNAFSAWSLTGAVAVNDEVAIEQGPPGLTSEVRLVSGMTGGTVNLAETTVYEFDGTKGTVWVRWRDFFPVCYLAAEDATKNPLTHDHRRNYSLDLRLYMAPSEVATVLGGDANRANPIALLLGNSTVANAGRGSSLESILGGASQRRLMQTRSGGF